MKLFQRITARNGSYTTIDLDQYEAMFGHEAKDDFVEEDKLALPAVAMVDGDLPEAFVIDYDHLTPAQCTGILKRLRDLKLRCLTHTSCRSTRESPKLHVLFPIEPCIFDWDRTLESLKLPPGDPTSKQRNKLWYVPTRSKEPIKAWRVDGALLRPVARSETEVRAERALLNRESKLKDLHWCVPRFSDFEEEARTTFKELDAFTKRYGTCPHCGRPKYSIQDNHMTGVRFGRCFRDTCIGAVGEYDETDKIDASTFTKALSKHFERIRLYDCSCIWWRNENRILKERNMITSITDELGEPNQKDWPLARVISHPFYRPQPPLLIDRFEDGLWCQVFDGHVLPVPKVAIVRGQRHFKVSELVQQETSKLGLLAYDQNYTDAVLRRLPPFVLVPSFRREGDRSIFKQRVKMAQDRGCQVFFLRNDKVRIREQSRRLGYRDLKAITFEALQKQIAEVSQ